MNLSENEGIKLRTLPLPNRRGMNEKNEGWVRAKSLDLGAESGERGDRHRRDSAA